MRRGAPRATRETASPSVAPQTSDGKRLRAWIGGAHAAAELRAAPACAPTRFARQLLQRATRGHAPPAARAATHGCCDGGTGPRRRAAPCAACERAAARGAAAGDAAAERRAHAAARARRPARRQRSLRARGTSGPRECGRQLPLVAPCSARPRPQPRRWHCAALPGVTRRRLGNQLGAQRRQRILPSWQVRPSFF